VIITDIDIVPASASSSDVKISTISSSNPKKPTLASNRKLTQTVYTIPTGRDSVSAAIEAVSKSLSPLCGPWFSKKQSIPRVNVGSDLAPVATLKTASKKEDQVSVKIGGLTEAKASNASKRPWAFQATGITKPKQQASIPKSPPPSYASTSGNIDDKLRFGVAATSVKIIPSTSQTSQDSKINSNRNSLTHNSGRIMTSEGSITSCTQIGVSDAAAALASTLKNIPMPMLPLPPSPNPLSSSK